MKLHAVHSSNRATFEPRKSSSTPSFCHKIAIWFIDIFDPSQKVEHKIDKIKSGELFKIISDDQSTHPLYQALNFLYSEFSSQNDYNSLKLLAKNIIEETQKEKLSIIKSTNYNKLTNKEKIFREKFKQILINNKICDHRILPMGSIYTTTACYLLNFIDNFEEQKEKIINYKNIEVSEKIRNLSLEERLDLIIKMSELDSSNDKVKIGGKEYSSDEITKFELGGILKEFNKVKYLTQKKKFLEELGIRLKKSISLLPFDVKIRFLCCLTCDLDSILIVLKKYPSMSSFIGFMSEIIEKEPLYSLLAELTYYSIGDDFQRFQDEISLMEALKKILKDIPILNEQNEKYNKFLELLQSISVFGIESSKNISQDNNLEKKRLNFNQAVEKSQNCAESRLKLKSEFLIYLSDFENFFNKNILKIYYKEMSNSSNSIERKKELDVLLEYSKSLFPALKSIISQDIQSVSDLKKAIISTLWVNSRILTGFLLKGCRGLFENFIYGVFEDVYKKEIYLSKERAPENVEISSEDLNKIKKFLEKSVFKQSNCKKFEYEVLKALFLFLYSIFHYSSKFNIFYLFPIEAVKAIINPTNMLHSIWFLSPIIHLIATRQIFVNHSDMEKYINNLENKNYFDALNMFVFVRENKNSFLIKSIQEFIYAEECLLNKIYNGKIGLSADVELDVEIILENYKNSPDGSLYFR